MCTERKTAKTNFASKKHCRNCKLREQAHSMFDTAINMKDNYPFISTLSKSELLYEKEDISLKSFY